MTELAQALVGGILIGGLYVAISIGFSLSFGVLDVVDLAVGMWVVLGAFAAIGASCTAVQTRLVFRLSEAGGSSTLVGETSSAPPWPSRCRAVPDSHPLRPERHRGRR